MKHRKHASWRAALAGCALALCCGAIPAQTQSAKPQRSVAGEWKDGGGHTIAITQSGNHVAMTAPSGRVLSGSLSGASLTLESDFAGSDVAGAPPDVQAAVDARHLKIRFTGTLDSSGLKITGTETRPDDIRWNGAHEIISIDTGRSSPVTMTRGPVVPTTVRIVSDKAPFTPLDTVPLGDPFRVELVYPQDPGADQEAVNLETSSGGKLKSVATREAGQTLRYRTATLYVEMPASQ